MSWKLSSSLLVALVGLSVLRAAGPAQITSLQPETVRRVVALPTGAGITVRWEALPGALQYAVYIATERFGTWTGRFRRVVVRSTEWSDSDLREGTVRFYAVAPIFPGREGRLSGEVTAEAVRIPAIPAIYLTLTPDNLRDLYSRPPKSNDLVPAQALYEPGRTSIAVGGLRFGGRFTRVQPKKNFRVQLNDRPSFNFGRPERRPSDHLNLNGLWFDPSGLKEFLAFEHYRALGMPAPATVPIDVYINGSFEGHYMSIERVDHEATRGWKLPGSDGSITLIRNEDHSSGFVLFSRYDDSKYQTDVERIAFMQEWLEYRGESTDWAAMLDMVRWLQTAKPGAAIVPELSRRFELDQLIDFVAVSALTSDYDSFGGVDVWWYRANLPDARWRPIPWDKDLTFGDSLVGDCGCPVNPDRPFYRGGDGDAVFSLVLQTPELRARVVDRLRVLSQTVFTSDWYADRIRQRWPSAAAGIAAPRSGRRWEVHPQQHMGALGHFPYHVEALRDFIERRRAFLTATVTDPVPRSSPYRVSLRADGLTPAYVVTADRVAMRVTPLEAPGRPVAVSLEVRQIQIADGIARTYAVTVDHPLRAEITLYYAANRSTSAIGTGSDDLDRRWAVEIQELRADGVRVPLRTYTNPYAGSVSTVVTLTEPMTFVLAFGR